MGQCECRAASAAKSFKLRTFAHSGDSGGRQMPTASCQDVSGLLFPWQAGKSQGCRPEDRRYTLPS
jgi:hypothetical protein